MRRARYESARNTMLLTLRQRCFWLFAAQLLIVVWVPFLENSTHGRVILNAATFAVLIAATGVISRSGGAIAISALLALPTALFLVLALAYDQPQVAVLSQAFAAAFYFTVVSYLLSYTMRRDVMTMDKLYGAAAAYLLLGVVWAYLYQIVLAFYPGALTMNGQPLSSMPPSTMLYFSFVTLTATGMSDILPLHPVARMLCALEMIAGVLFIAMLIARLAGTYPPKER